MHPGVAEAADADWDGLFQAQRLECCHSCGEIALKQQLRDWNQRSRVHSWRAQRGNLHAVRWSSSSAADLSTRVGK